jgi:Polyketide cyclase / dehydrase and lipid transport
MIGFTESIVMRTTPEKAFAYLGDPATATIVDPAVISYEPDSIPMRAGTRNRVRARLGVIAVTMTTQVLSWEEGRRMVIESVRPSRPFKATATHRFDSHRDGTLYTWSMEFAPTFRAEAWRLASPRGSCAAPSALNSGGSRRSWRVITTMGSRGRFT